MFAHRPRRTCGARSQSHGVIIHKVAAAGPLLQHMALTRCVRLIGADSFLENRLAAVDSRKGTVTQTDPARRGGGGTQKTFINFIRSLINMQFSLTVPRENWR